MRAMARLGEPRDGLEVAASSEASVASAGGPQPPQRPAAVLPGLVAGIAETVAVQPLDMVKTRFQIREGANPSLVRGLMEVYREGGVMRFYRGLLPEVASTAPARTAMYASFTWTLHHLEGSLGNRRLETFAAGFASGVPESLVVTPLQVIKVRLQAKEHLGRYQHAVHCARTIAAEEGAAALLTGLGPTCCRNCVFNGVYLATLSELQQRLGTKHEDKTAGWRGHAASVLQTSGCAFLAGVFATCFNAPFDTVKSRIQQQVVCSATGGRRYTGTAQALMLIWKEEGPRAVYKGFVPKVWRMSLGGAFGMGAFEAAQTFLS